jgi:trehalose 6-phosphate synthase
VQFATDDALEDPMKRLLIVSNRLPVAIEKIREGFEVRGSSGGLVSALRPITQKFGGCWIGSLDDPDAAPALEKFAQDEGVHLSPVFLAPSLRKDYYCGFCNEILWPLFHDLQSRCNFEPRYWHRYLEANRQFSQAVLARATKTDTVWVHDYHLMLQGSLLRGHFDRRRLVYFHHVPFPPADVFEKLPWRKHILESLLAFGLIGFQTSRDRYNFVACVRRLFSGPIIKRKAGSLAVEVNGVETAVGTFPIGIHFADFSVRANDSKVKSEARAIREHFGDCRLILGLDRLDYTKGILERIKGFSVLLERYPGLHGAVALVQIAVPSREGIGEYLQLKERLEQMIESVNDRFARPGWVPIHYLHRHLSRAEVVAYYRAADIALVTPLKDGMNLVCKEFCASRVDEDGILILSEFAGAAGQLRTGAILVNPYDAEGVASALYQALEMDPRDASRRMRRMRNVVRYQDVFAWCDDFLGCIDVVPGSRGPYSEGVTGKAPLGLKPAYFNAAQVSGT